MDLMSAFPREYRFKGILFDYPSLMLAIIGAYLLIALKIGPEFMRDRKPYSFKNITRLYNIIQVSDRRLISLMLISGHSLCGTSQFVPSGWLSFLRLWPSGVHL